MDDGVELLVLVAVGVDLVANLVDDLPLEPVLSTIICSRCETDREDILGPRVFVELVQVPELALVGLIDDQDGLLPVVLTLQVGLVVHSGGPLPTCGFAVLRERLVAFFISSLQPVILKDDVNIVISLLQEVARDGRVDAGLALAGRDHPDLGRDVLVVHVGYRGGGELEVGERHLDLLEDAADLWGVIFDQLLLRLQLGVPFYDGEKGLCNMLLVIQGSKLKPFLGLIGPPV